MEKLRAEIASTCGSTPYFARDDLKRMPYLQNVLKESKCLQHLSNPTLLLIQTALRLYPSVPVNTRTTVRTTVLPTGGGPDRKSPVLIPKGSAVAFSVYSMHRRPDLYGMDAELFRPERWDEDMPLQHNPTNAKWGYLPFHGGPRICLGSELFPNPTRRSILIDTRFNSGFRAHRSRLHRRTSPAAIPNDQAPRTRKRRIGWC